MKRFIIILFVVLPLAATIFWWISGDSVISSKAITRLQELTEQKLGKEFQILASAYHGNGSDYHEFTKVVLKYHDEMLFSTAKIVIDNRQSKKDVRLSRVVQHSLTIPQIDVPKNTLNGQVNIAIDHLVIQPLAREIETIVLTITPSEISGSLNSAGGQLQFSKNENQPLQITGNFPTLAILAPKNVIATQLKQLLPQKFQQCEFDLTPGLEFSTYLDLENFNWQDLASTCGSLRANFAYPKGVTTRLLINRQSGHAPFVHVESLKLKIFGNPLYLSGSMQNQTGRFELSSPTWSSPLGIVAITSAGSFVLENGSPQFRLQSQMTSLDEKIIKELSFDLVGNSEKIELSGTVQGEIRGEYTGIWHPAKEKIDFTAQLLHQRGDFNFEGQYLQGKLRKLEFEGNPVGLFSTGEHVTFDWSEQKGFTLCFPENPWIIEPVVGQLSYQDDNVVLLGKKLALRFSPFPLGLNHPIINGWIDLSTQLGIMHFDLATDAKFITIAGKGIDLDSLRCKAIVNLQDHSVKLEQLHLGKTLKMSGNLSKELEGKINFSADATDLFADLLPVSKSFGFAKSTAWLKQQLPKIGQFFGSLTLNKQGRSLNVSYGKKENTVLVAKNDSIVFSSFPLHIGTLTGSYTLLQGGTLHLALNKEGKTIASSFSAILGNITGIKLLASMEKNICHLNVFLTGLQAEIPILQTSILLQDGKLYFTDLLANIADIKVTGNGRVDSSGNYFADWKIGKVTEELLRELGAPKFLKGFSAGFGTLKIVDEQLTLEGNLQNPSLYGSSFEKLDYQISTIQQRGYLLKMALKQGSQTPVKAHFFLKELKSPSDQPFGVIELTNFATGGSSLASGDVIDPGIMNGQIEMEMTPKGVIFHGNGTFKEGYLQNSHGKLFTSIKGSFEARETRFQVTGFATAKAADNVRLSGWIAPFTANGRADYEFDVKRRSMDLAPLFQGLTGKQLRSQAKVDVDLKAFNSISERAQIIGELKIHNGVLRHEDLTVLSGLNEEKKFDHQLKILLADELLMQTPLFSGESMGSLTVNGLDCETSVSGLVEIINGKISYLGRNFTLDKGEIRISTLKPASSMGNLMNSSFVCMDTSSRLSGLFDYKYSGIAHAISLEATRDKSKVAIQTSLSLTGSTREKGRDIFMTVAGDVSQLAIHFTAEPEMKEKDIEYMLFGVKLVTENNQIDSRNMDQQQNQLMNFLGTQVQSAIWNQIGSSLEKELNLDEFTITTEHENGESLFLSDLEINIGKYVNRDLFISYRKNVMDSSYDSLGMKYKIGSHLILGGQFKQNSEMSMDARLGLSF